MPATSAAGPGWSRPTSSPSPVALTNAVPNLPVPSVPVMPTAAPQLPHAGKVIQPQPRAAASSVPTIGSQKDSSTASSKPVWGNVRPTTNAPLKADLKAQNEFPTAAEVAQGMNPVISAFRPPKLEDLRPQFGVPRSWTQKKLRKLQLLTNKLDWKKLTPFEVFIWTLMLIIGTRSVVSTVACSALNTTGSIYFQMEEDDNYLDGVIEFGDGRQYKIPTAELQPQPPSPLREPTSMHGDADPPSNSAGSLYIPVSKEERFADDFDRSWPRSKTSPPVPAREFPTPGPHSVPPSLSPVSSQSLQSPQESSRVLFNERSNRLEPYSNSYPPHRSGQSPFPPKRSSQSDIVSSPTESRSARDLPHTQAQSGVQLLQKPGNISVADSHPRPRGLGSGFGAGPSNPFVNDRSRDRETCRPDDRPLSPSYPPPHSPDLKRTRGHHNPFSFQSGSSNPKDRDLAGERGRRSSAMGPQVPSLQGRSKETGRQLPPHLSTMPPPPIPIQRRMPSQDSQTRPSQTSQRGEPSSFVGASVHTALQSPVPSHVSIASPVSDCSPQVSAIPMIDLDEVRKDVMQSAAARAKQRRQQEEEEREKDKERARRKAAKLEEKMKSAVETEGVKVKSPEKQFLQSQVCLYCSSAINI